MNDIRSTIDSEARKDPSRLEREIDQQRDHIEGLVGALESKVSPHELFDRAMAYGKDNGGEIARNFGAVVKANPVPALLTAAGLLWLYSSSRTAPESRDPALRSRFGDYRVTGVGAGTYRGSYADEARDGDAASGTMGEADSDDDHHVVEDLKAGAARLREGASHLRDNASGTWHDATSRLGEGMHHARDSVRHRATAARTGFEHMLDGNPMVAGALAVAVGALLGATLPTSEPERRMLRPVGEKLSGKAHEAADLARETGRRGLDAVRELGEPPSSPAGEAENGGSGQEDMPAA